MMLLTVEKDAFNRWLSSIGWKSCIEIPRGRTQLKFLYLLCEATQSIFLGKVWFDDCRLGFFPLIVKSRHFLS